MLHALQDVGELSPTGLATPVLNQELADDRRAALESAAATFDPLGLYAEEIERDETIDELAHNLPETVPFSVTRFVQTFKLGADVRVKKWWTAWIGEGDSHEGDTATEAAAKALAAYQRGTTMPPTFPRAA